MIKIFCDFCKKELSVNKNFNISIAMQYGSNASKSKTMNLCETCVHEFKKRITVGDKK